VSGTDGATWRGRGGQQEGDGAESIATTGLGEICGRGELATPEVRCGAGRGTTVTRGGAGLHGREKSDWIDGASTVKKMVRWIEKQWQRIGVAAVVSPEKD
jgi:hypothetical protein